MQWLEWGETAFESARNRGSPVLLLLTASWCRFCRELEGEVLSNPAIQSLIEKHFIAIRVDKDRRPDIDARYSRGGWPTLAYLDEFGELIAADTYVEAEELGPRLELVAGHYAENRDAIRRQLSEAAEVRFPSDPPRASRIGGVPTGRMTPQPLSGELVDWVARTLLETADPVYGGWGSSQKFPHPEGIDFALLRWSQTGEEAMRKLVVRTLRNMERGEIHDRVEGGFYRYATSSDWSQPHYEKTLDSNARRLYAFLEAHQALGEATFRETAQGILRFLCEVLRDPATGAFRGSQDADPAYARLPSLRERRARKSPACDPTIFADWNAMAVSSLFAASAVFGDTSYAEHALSALDFLLEELYDERQGMFHYWDGSYHLPGLLSDQAYTLRALTDAAVFAGRNDCLKIARSLAGVALESLKCEGGGFFDTRYDPLARGVLRQRNCSILENAVMAEALLRLSHLTRDEDSADAARDTLASFAGDYKRYGHYVAGYARAVDLLLRPPVHVTIVGEPASGEVGQLRAAALKPYFASRIVQVIDPRCDVELLERSGLPAIGRTSAGGVHRARAYVHRGRSSFAETDDPARLPSLMTRVEPR